ncbi:myeloid cell surface antigen CD33-like [Hypanus sabinus]|uniref:myeloid cell surface antigen CD33-like n=1 Tax=Hypanus sabinus TaxID=79690 RepID=UPI0028C3E160|nr:myeloid cell surface antigen CD33-like [Hypanus sabinus]
MSARIPCKYTYPLRLANETRTAIWFNSEQRKRQPVAFHSKNSSQVSSNFQHRTELAGDVKDNDCSLIINNVTEADEGYYYFRIEFGNKNNYSFFPATKLLVSNHTETPLIFPFKLDAGKPVNISCTFNFKCNASTLSFTWVSSPNASSSAPTTVIQQRGTWTFTSVLTLTPTLKDHGQKLSCRVTYPSASSERTITLIVQSPTSVQSSLIIPLATAAVVVFLIIASAVICLIIKARWRRDRPAERASRPASGEAARRVTWRKRQTQENVPKCLETTPKVNEYQDMNIYANCQPAESSIYGNI